MDTMPPKKLDKQADKVLNHKPEKEAPSQQVVLSLEELKQELLPLVGKIDQFTDKLDTVVRNLTEYVDSQIGQVSSRVEKVEKELVRAQGTDTWLVVQGVEVGETETPVSLRAKVDEVLDAVGVDPSTSVQECFRMGHSHNPSYVPIIKVRLENREVVQKAIKQSGRLRRAGFHKVFIRESRPQWATGSGV